MLVAFICHYIACGWCGITYANEEGSQTWLAATRFTSGSQSYVIAFHWLWARMTSAPFDIAPANISECIFATAVVLVVSDLSSMSLP